MNTLVEYRFDGGVATVRMDDGKVNVLGPGMLAELGAAFDQAEADDATVLLTGREGVFSAGFDLSVLRAGGGDALGMVRGGFELAERVLAFRRPVLMACPGHAIAMGLFLLQSGDYRIGLRGAFRLMANEVALGLTMPRPALAILRQKLTPAAFSRAVLLAEPFGPDDAVAAGLLDRAVEPGELDRVARETADALSNLDQNAHATTKARVRAETLAAVRAGIEADYPAVPA